jgi:hypothetical protein
MNLIKYQKYVALVLLALFMGSCAESTSWKISQEDAKNIILRQYPDILHNASISGPVIAKVESGIDGFTEPNSEVWHVIVNCKKGGVHALFFVHPETGKLFALTVPDSIDSVKCD